MNQVKTYLADANLHLWKWLAVVWIRKKEPSLAAEDSHGRYGSQSLSLKIK